MKTEEKESKRYGVVSFERKSHRRFSVDLPIEYYRADSVIADNGRSLNGSEGGLLINFPEKIEIGQHLKLKLFFTSDAGLTAIQMLAEVVWTDICMSEACTDYRSGVKFINISPEDMRKLKDFLESLSQ